MRLPVYNGLPKYFPELNLISVEDRMLRASRSVNDLDRKAYGRRVLEILGQLLEPSFLPIVGLDCRRSSFALAVTGRGWPYNICAKKIEAHLGSHSSLFLPALRRTGT